MILCCANCENPIPRWMDSDMFCSERCAGEFDEAILADAGLLDDDPWGEQ